MEKENLTGMNLSNYFPPKCPKCGYEDPARPTPETCPNCGFEKEIRTIG